MQCICEGRGDLIEDEIVFEYRNEEVVFIVKDVPVHTCLMCGREFFEEEVKQALDHVFEKVCENKETISILSYMDWSGRCCNRGHC
jgi:hypothetical protein